jgi:hypothetical protein
MLLKREISDPITVIEKLGGLQAQQARPPFVGLWTRLESFKREQLLKPVHARKVLRATTLRGTLHLITPRDFAAWRPVLQPMFSAGAQSILRDRLTTFDPALVLEAARKSFGARARTFTSLRDELVASFPDGDERAMGYFVRMHLPLASLADANAPWGFSSDAEFNLDADAHDTEGDAQSLVLRYLAAFGPASIADFQAWSGIKQAKPVFEALQSKLLKFQDPKKRILFDIPEAPRPSEDTPAPVRFIAEFDNLVLGHADRTRIVSELHRPRVVTKNLLVLGTFLIDGFVAGIWKCERKKKEAILKLEPFEKVAPKVRKELEREGLELARFLEPDATNFSVTLHD